MSNAYIVSWYIPEMYDSARQKHEEPPIRIKIGTEQYYPPGK